MPETIKDGTGTGKLLRVDDNNRAHVSSISIDENLQANKDGNAYNVNTKDITLTNDTETPVLYIKNNENKDIHIRTVVIGIKVATGATLTQANVTFIRNPLAGTVVSDASVITINSNRNYGSSSTLDADIYEGTTGKTLTGGDEHIYIYASTNSRTGVSIDEIIPKGSTFGVTITPPASNTSMPCYVAVIMHLDDSENN